MTVVNYDNTMETEEDWTTGLSSAQVCDIKLELHQIEAELEIERLIASMDDESIKKEWMKMKKECELVD